MNVGVDIIVGTLGGLGMFLLGMIIMTEGLHELAGDAIRAALMRFTSTPLRSAITGALSTALLQSSSATTVAAVGFVGAGLMTFTSSLGIIFGANIGTTITGWLVALLGFKLKLGTILLPFIFVGAILRLFTTGKISSVGYTFAGFGLIFVGIAAMQEGMGGLQGVITPETLPTDTALGRLVIVLIGILFTAITQSSSTGVAAAMTALYTGVISFEQGLALVIGMNIGTTITALLATVGRSTGARRTGISHLIYNLLTGMGAVFLITPYVMFWEYVAPVKMMANPEIALVAFHTLFNTLGVALILPFTHQFARFIKKLIPEPRSFFASSLDDSLLRTPSFALTAVQQTLVFTFAALLNHIRAILTDERNGGRTDLAGMQQALDKTERYLERIQMKAASDVEHDRLIELIHTLDHLQRLHERCEEDEDRAVVARETEWLETVHQSLLSAVGDVLEALKVEGWQASEKRALAVAQVIREQVEPIRNIISKNQASGKVTADRATNCLEAVRWLDRVAHHIARISRHLRQAMLASGK